MDKEHIRKLAWVNDWDGINSALAVSSCGFSNQEILLLRESENKPEIDDPYHLGTVADIMLSDVFDPIKGRQVFKNAMVGNLFDTGLWVLSKVEHSDFIEFGRITEMACFADERFLNMLEAKFGEDTYRHNTRSILHMLGISKRYDKMLQILDKSDSDTWDGTLGALAVQDGSGETLVVIAEHIFSKDIPRRKHLHHTALVAATCSNLGNVIALLPFLRKHTVRKLRPHIAAHFDESQTKTIREFIGEPSEKSDKEEVCIGYAIGGKTDNLVSSIRRWNLHSKTLWQRIADFKKSRTASEFIEICITTAASNGHRHTVTVLLREFPLSEERKRIVMKEIQNGQGQDAYAITAELQADILKTKNPSSGRRRGAL